MWWEWRFLVGVASGLVGGYLILIVALWRVQRRQTDPVSLRETLRLIPDVIRLLRRLAADTALPRGVRLRLVLLIAYLVSPIDLIPDFIPVVGYADDALMVAMVLRSVIRHAGPEAIAQHWTGTADGLRTLQRLTGLPR